MGKKLILIRHGKAEPRQEALDEASRKLTEKGIKDLEKTLPALKAHLGGLKLRLVSSGLPRAAQTAGFIANYMGIEAPEQLDWVESGDLAGLREAYKNLDPAFTLAVVGHEPYLSAWSRQLCGYTIPFRKGGAVGFSITSEEPLSARPEWMVLSATAHPQGLRIKPWASAAPEFRKILRFQGHEVFQFLQKFLDAPGDPATVHQFRISVRTLRAVLYFMRPLLDPEQYKTAQNQLRELAHKMGRLREIDVLKSKWLKLLKAYPPLAEEKSVLLKVLTSERQKEQDLVYAETSDMMSAIFGVLKWVEDAWAPEAAGAGETKRDAKPRSFASLNQKRLRRRLEKVNADVKVIADSDFKAIHELRIQIKKLRYALSIIKPLLNLPREDTIALLKDLQDVFGDYCDTQRNLAILKELNAQNASAEMRCESALISGYQIRMMEESLDKIKAVEAIW